MPSSWSATKPTRSGCIRSSTASRRSGPTARFGRRRLGRILSGLSDPKCYAAPALPDLLQFAIELDAVGGIAGSDGEVAEALGPLTRMLSAEAYNLRRVATGATGLSATAQLAYAAALHGLADLQSAASKIVRERRERHFALRWTSAAASGVARHWLPGHEEAVLGCAISGDGRTGLSASADHTLMVWDLKRGAMRHRLPGHEEVVWGCAISGDGRIGLSASEDRTLIVWDLERGAMRHRLPGTRHGSLAVRSAATAGPGCRRPMIAR